MLLMASPPVEKRVIVGEYVVAEHKPKGRGPVNTQPLPTRCGISI